MDRDLANRCRKDIERLIVAQRESAICPNDGQPCYDLDRGCSEYAFGSFAEDGKETLVWSCPRNKKR